MRRFKTILCPTDFSEDSYRALEYASRLAEIDGGTLLLTHIVHVSTENRYDKEGHQQSFEEMKQHALAELEAVRSQRLANSRCELLLEVGPPAEVLVRIAEQRACDLIVLCTHGRTSLKGLVIGSVAESIVRHAPCPVFVVRRGIE
jgi:universal stress protein A